MSIIDDYLAGLPPAERAELERVRQIIRRVAPGAEEVKTYGMPGFKYKGHYLVAFAAFKDHLSLFPTGAPIEMLKEKLHGFKTSKGTIQFTLEHPLPGDIIEVAVSLRLNAIEASSLTADSDRAENERGRTIPGNNQ